MATAQLGTLLRHIHKLAAGRLLPQRNDHQLLDDFSARHDEAAFAALVARHGPMVLRVCRRVLNHEQDAEDCFQATFLILARHTSSIRKRGALAQWLHGVAHRTALEAKRKAARRRNHEAQLRVRRTPVVARSGDRPTTSCPTWDDVQAVLDSEIARLPEAFRTAFVLCVLEGKSGPQAAAELGVRPGTVSSRLTRARQRLRRQLARRGIKLAALLAAVSVAESSSKAAVPALLASATVRSGLLVAAGGTAAGVIPSHVAALAAGVTRAMFLTKAKIAAAVLFALSLFAAGAGVLTHQVLSAPQETPPAAKPPAATIAKPQTAEAKPQATNDKDSISYSGRVLDPDGKPVAGAKLYVTLEYGFPHRPEQFPLDATTGPDGRFKFTAPKGKYRGTLTSVGAMAANYGAGWVMVPVGGRRDDLTLQLVKDDVPITGQIVDLEGRPVPDATLRVLRIDAAPGEDLSPWLEAVKAKKGLAFQLAKKYLTRSTIALSPTVRTDANGRFRLSGVGCNRLVLAQLDAPTIASEQLHILTRPRDTLEVPKLEGNPKYGEPRVVLTYYGANFRHVASPTKPIAGQVRDKDTKKPLAGVTIRSYKLANSPFHGVEIVQTMTDAQGRYRLTGMPKGEGNKIRVVPPGDLPYVAVLAEVPDKPGLDPVIVDFDLKRGVWIEGRITDKGMGKAVQGRVEYFAHSSNPNLGDYEGFEAAPPTISEAKEDGSYRVVGLPGPGLVAVYAIDHYLRGHERDDEDGIAEDSEVSPYHIMFPSNYSAFARIDSAKGVTSLKRDVTLDRGWTFTGMVIGPEGKPLAGVRSFGLTGMPMWGMDNWDREGMKTARFTVRGFNPRRPRDVLFQHLEKGLVGVAQPPQKNGASVTVRMEPGAAVTGRLVDADGQPRAGVELQLSFRPKQRQDWPSYSPERINTDREGRFRVGALLPKYEYQLSDGKGELPVGEGLRSGKTKDLGDVQMKTNNE